LVSRPCLPGLAVHEESTVADSLSLPLLSPLVPRYSASADEDRLEKLISELSGKDINEVIAEGSKKLASVPSGGAGPAAAAGGASAGAAVEEKKEEKVEEKEESDDDMGCVPPLSLPCACCQRSGELTCPPSLSSLLLHRLAPALPRPRHTLLPSTALASSTLVVLLARLGRDLEADSLTLVPLAPAVNASSFGPRRKAVDLSLRSYPLASRSCNLVPQLSQTSFPWSSRAERASEESEVHSVHARRDQRLRSRECVSRRARARERRQRAGKVSSEPRCEGEERPERRFSRILCARSLDSSSQLCLLSFSQLAELPRRTLTGSKRPRLDGARGTSARPPSQMMALHDDTTARLRSPPPTCSRA